MASPSRPLLIPRRAALLGGASLLLSPPALAQRQQSTRQVPRLPVSRIPPVIFVHGNGDTAALWHMTIWRFESNGYPRNMLAAIDFSYPSARSDDSKPQPFRSSTTEQRDELAAFVRQVMTQTRRRKVALVGSSRGCNTIRNYVKNGGGAEFVSHVVLCGGTNHGVVVSDTMLVGSEFNGAAPFLKQLNAGESEVVPGPAFMTLRSDKFDKYAQPDGQFIGQPGKPTGVGYDAPELKGASNVVLPGLDHREVAFHKLAFARMFEFIVGRAPTSTFIAAEREVVLNGKVTGIADGVYTNLPVSGAMVEIWEIDAMTGARRIRLAAHRKVTGADGMWGPFRTNAEAYLEFVITVAGSPITHIYRSPFTRSSDIVHLRPGRFGRDDEKAGAVVYMSRPRGYFGHGRDKFTLDGKVPPGINEGVPGTSIGRLTVEASPERTIKAVFNNEEIPARNWPVKDGHLVIAEFHN
jgi:pimeloyl-ACP methyl ester carboxylesterase